MPAAVAIAVTSSTAAVAVRADDYPTWDEVEAARADQASAQAEIARIEGILIRLEQEAQQLGTEALVAGEAYARAQDDLADATARLERIREQSAAAQARADESEQRVAALVAQLARDGGGDISVGLLLSSSDDADSLLARLDTMGRIGDSSAALLERAIYDKKVAEALAQDAAVAETERVRLAGLAAEALAQAEEAAVAAEQAAAAQRDDLSRMYAQLAALKGTTAETEQAYYEGLAPATQTAPTTPTTPTSPTTPSPSPSATSTPTPSSSPSAPSTPTEPSTPPATSKVETAIAYAEAQLGEPYQFGGAGPSSWDCSGLTKQSYAAAGVYIGTHSVSNQYATMSSQGRLVPTSQLQRGDLLFYGTGGSSSSLYHVAIYLGNGQMIEAPRPGANVRIVSIRYGDLAAYAGRPA